mgnify:CR=1 FL=1
MKTINTVKKLQDELATIAEISREIPLPYKVIIERKIIGFNAYLSKISPDLDQDNNPDLHQKTK